jgi:hypothetical protein
MIQLFACGDCVQCGPCLPPPPISASAVKLVDCVGGEPTAIRYRVGLQVPYAEGDGTGIVWVQPVLVPAVGLGDEIMPPTYQTPWRFRTPAGTCEGGGGNTWFEYDPRTQRVARVLVETRNQTLPPKFSTASYGLGGASTICQDCTSQDGTPRRYYVNNPGIPTSHGPEVGLPCTGDPPPPRDPEAIAFLEDLTSPCCGGPPGGGTRNLDAAPCVYNEYAGTALCAAAWRADVYHTENGRDWIPDTTDNARAARSVALSLGAVTAGADIAKPRVAGTGTATVAGHGATLSITVDKRLCEDLPRIGGVAVLTAPGLQGTPGGSCPSWGGTEDFEAVVDIGSPCLQYVVQGTIRYGGSCAGYVYIWQRLRRYAEVRFENLRIGVRSKP